MVDLENAENKNELGAVEIESSERRHCGEMKKSTIANYISLATIGILGGALAATNPSPTAYTNYAVQRLTTYIKVDFCDKAPKFLKNLLHQECTLLVDLSGPQLQQIINRDTQQQNWIFFSIYRTDLVINSLVPTYHFETIGVLQNFFTYNVQKR